MPNRPQEEYCRDQFDRWLRRQCPSAVIRWENGSEPPDFWLSVAEQRFAVEVTRLMTPMTIQVSLWRRVEDVKKRLVQEGRVHGTYAVEFDDTPDDYGAPDRASRKHRDQSLRNLIENYVNRTAGSSSTGAQEAHITPNGRCRICKASAEGQIIGPVGPDDEGGWRDDIRREVTALLQRAIHAKARLVNEHGARAVLILDDLYAMADRSLLKECLESIQESARPWTIYVVQDAQRGYVAYGGDFSS